MADESYAFQYSSVVSIIEKFKRLELHASRAGREVMNVFSHVVEESNATDIESLVADINSCVDAILEVMPAYAPPLNVMHTIMYEVEKALERRSTVKDLKESILNAARNFRKWSEEAREKLSLYGTNLVSPDTKVFTFTLSETVLHTLLKAWEMGKKFDVIITESRPNNDGLITAETLSNKGITVSLGVDANIGELIQKADIVIIGAEAILADGSAVCKVGTYPSVLLAWKLGVPVYVIVDSMKFSVSSRIGIAMSMDLIQPRDIFTQGNHEHSRVIGHLFDCTPPGLIKGIVTEKGILNPSECMTVTNAMRISKTLSEKLSTRAKQKRRGDH